MDYPITADGLARLKADGLARSGAVSCRAALRRLQTIVDYCDVDAIPDEKGARETIPDGPKKGMNRWKLVALPEEFKPRADEIRGRAIDLLEALPCLTEGELRELNERLVKAVGTEAVTHEQLEVHLKEKTALLESRPRLTMDQVRSRLDGINELIAILRDDIKRFKKETAAKERVKTAEPVVGRKRELVRLAFDKERGAKPNVSKESIIKRLAARHDWEFDSERPDKPISMTTIRGYVEDLK